ncbi:MAG: hypothetical protein F4Y47_05230 [Acidobacteriia bacterium]|nr:hypothetical protein [Terriglobia bacterium]MYG01614.1 hypothetical protein [Terriglobia bacterium]MYK08382.1 hypothetical protein [Terriglobia bacterium]
MKHLAIACIAIEPFRRNAVIRVHGVIFGTVTLLIAATVASSQDGPRPSQATLARADAVQEVVARSEQPEARQENGQAAAEPLAADRESDLAEADASRQQLRALLNSSMLALSRVEREDRQDRFERSRPLGSDWSFGADRSRPPRFGRGPGWGMPGRGRPLGAGRRGRGGRGGNRF